MSLGLDPPIPDPWTLPEAGGVGAYDRRIEQILVNRKIATPISAWRFVAPTTIGAPSRGSRS